MLADTQKVASSKTGAALSPDEWRRIVGAKIASRTRVGRLSREVLTVYVASSAWCNELSLLAPDILSRLRLAGIDVEKLELRVSAVDDTGAQAAPRNGRARAPGSAAPGAAGSVKNASPSRTSTSRDGHASHKALPASLQERLALIDDPELRAAIAEAAALSLART